MAAMSNEFGTVNVRRGDRTREIEILRQRYNRHRENLSSLAADAPSDQLAIEYARLIREIDTALGKLGELEGKRPSDTQPGTRPLVTPPGMIMPDTSEPPAAGAALPRVALIIGAGLVVLILIGWLMWRASGERLATNTARTSTEVATETKRSPLTPAPRPVLAALKAEPATQDYGTIRKGTRAVRQFQLTNNTDQPLSLDAARSMCRCLYYEYRGVPAHGKETLTVTIDGARAKRGALHETVAVWSRKDPSVTANLDVTATIR
jgi:hypothetical protein